MTSSRTSWLAAGVVTLVALVLRLVDLASPGKIVFDEVYYSKDAHDLLVYGVERNETGTGPGFVAHPPLGKWCIALGEWVFGNDPLGWRIAPALAGALSVLVLVRVGRRLFGSTLLGCAAGLLLALDGLHFVLSRTALLDIFLTLFVLVAFACLLLARDTGRTRWVVATGVFLGLALGVKWSALYFVPVFLLLIVVWRRALGPVLIVVGVAFVAYVATWTGWFVTDGGWARQEGLAGLWHYHREVWRFHSTLEKPHDYQSTPWSWLVLGRPVLFFYETDCGGAECRRAIIALGTPLLWWSFLPALVVTLWRWLAARDFRAGVVLLVVLSGWVPWMFFPHRTMFLFYTLPIVPFLILAVVYALGLVLGPASAPRDRRLLGAVLAASYVVVIAATFAYFYPVYTGIALTPGEFTARLWFDSWFYLTG